MVWAAQIGTVTFHPWPVTRADVEHPDELRLTLIRSPEPDFSDCVTAALAAYLDGRNSAGTVSSRHPVAEVSTCSCG